MAKRRKRQFTLGDLQEMVHQLGGRLSLQIYPEELEPVLFPAALPAFCKTCGKPAECFPKSGPSCRSCADKTEAAPKKKGKWKK